MSAHKSYEFSATIDIVGINPYVFVPEKILGQIFKDAGKCKGSIPICGKINDVSYQQTLVRFQGQWRLYINTSMLKNSPKRIGENIRVSIQFDTADRSIPMHPKLKSALQKNEIANAKFECLSPSLQNEIVRYIARLKNEESVDRNIEKAIMFLLGKGRFVGREL